MRITPTSGLSQEEIDRIINEAEDMAETDRSERELIELQSRLTGLVKNTQRTYLEFGGLLQSEQQEAAQRTLSEAEAAVHSPEKGEVRMALDSLDRLGRQLTSAMMKQGADAVKEEAAEESEQD
jgi:molecular chaperone DnaK